MPKQPVRLMQNFIRFETFFNASTFGCVPVNRQSTPYNEVVGLDEAPLNLRFAVVEAVTIDRVGCPQSKRFPLQSLRLQ